MLNKFLSHVRELVYKNITEVIEETNPIEQAMNYSASSESKMIRAALIYASAENNSQLNPLSKLTLATSIELVHTYSLIHDDLPSMDNDDYRRGKESNHIKFGEANAILAGDALQALAYQIIANDAYLNSDMKVEAISMLSSACGKNGMVYGQYLDIKNETKETKKNEIELIHSLKTGKLIDCAVMLGQIGNSKNKYIDKYHNFGKKIGLAFQIKDDILEVTSDRKTLGKSTNSDEKNNKATYVNTVGLDNAIKESESLTEAAINEISDDNISGTNMLIELAKYITHREA
jgi:geranylgeranyl pyrophosphate synthase